MSSFQISDPAATIKLDLKEEAGVFLARGSMPFVVSNLSKTRLSATVEVRASEGLPPGAFALVGASPVNPAVTSFDFGPEETRTVTVTLAVPAEAAPREGTFGIVVALETDPENDATASRPVALVVPGRPAAPPKPARAFPWPILAIGAVLALAVLGLLLWLLSPKTSAEAAKPEDLSGIKVVEDMLAYLDRHSEVRQLLVLINPANCINIDDRFRADPSLPDGVIIELGSRTGELCPSVEPRAAIGAKLDKLHEWQKAHESEVAITIPPFTKEEILLELSRQRERMSGLRMEYDPNACFGIDTLSQRTAIGSTTQPEFIVTIGTNSDSPCEVDDVRNETRERVSSYSRWASDNSVTSNRP